MYRCIAALIVLSMSYAAAFAADPTKPVKVVPGSEWTENRNCTYASSPPERTAKVLSFTCKDTSHNLEVVKSGKDYFIPRSTANDDPPYCLVKGPASASTIQVAKERRNMYCKNEWSWWQQIFAEIGLI